MLAEPHTHRYVTKDWSDATRFARLRSTIAGESAGCSKKVLSVQSRSSSLSANPDSAEDLRIWPMLTQRRCRF